MTEQEISIIDRYSTRAGLMFTVRDHNHYRIGQTVRYKGERYTITDISINENLNLTALSVIRK